MVKRLAFLVYALILFINGSLNAMFPQYQAPNAGNQQAYAVPPEYNFPPGSAQPVHYGDDLPCAPVDANMRRLNEEEGSNDQEDDYRDDHRNNEGQQPNYRLFRHLEHARPLIYILHAEDAVFDAYINSLENWGRSRPVKLSNAQEDIATNLNNHVITLNKALFDDLEAAYSYRVERINRLRNTVKSIRVGYGAQKFVEKPLLYMGIGGVLVALWNSIATNALFQWPSTTRKQQEECIVLYNKINEHARLLISNASGNAIRLLVQAKEDLNNYLIEKDYNPHLMELSLEEWFKRKSPDIIGPTNPPYILTTYHGNGAVTRQVLFDDETKFFLWRKTAFTLDCLITYNLSRLQHGQTTYSKEQKELLCSYYEGVLLIFKDQRWRLQKPSIKKGLGILAGSLAVGALWSYYVRVKKVDL